MKEYKKLVLYLAFAVCAIVLSVFFWYTDQPLPDPIPLQINEKNRIERLLPMETLRQKLTVTFDTLPKNAWCNMAQQERTAVTLHCFWFEANEAVPLATAPLTVDTHIGQFEEQFITGWKFDRPHLQLVPIMNCLPFTTLSLLCFIVTIASILLASNEWKNIERMRAHTKWCQNNL